MTYLRRVRLQRVHEDLTCADPATTTIATVAARWGFAHLSRFAGAYRATYGVSPSETLRTATPGGAQGVAGSSSSASIRRG